MAHYLDSFAEARRLLLPCLYLPAGTQLPKDASLQTKDADEESRRQSRIKLRVSPQVLPGVERAVEKACHNLRVPREKVHAYVSPQEGRNAKCMMSSDEPMIIFGSALVELMDEAELACIAGHEIGHFLLPESFFLYDPRSPEGRIHCRAAEITMDRIGLIACGDLSAACKAEMKLMSGLKEPHLRPDVAAFINEARIAFDGSFRSEEDDTHPPAQLRLRAIVEFAGSDACLKALDREGGIPVEKVNASISRLLTEQIDRHVIAQYSEPVLMAKAWFYCLCRSHGHDPELSLLNEVGPTVEMNRLQRAWASLEGFKEAQLREHAHKRMATATDNAFQRAPQTTRQFLRFISEHSSFISVRHLLTPL